MKIYKTKESLIVEIPLYQDALDYLGEKVGEISNIIGVICNDECGNEEMGFHHLIDMTYKGKAPQIDGLLVSFHRDKKKFIELCKKLDIDVFEYPICGTCKKTVYGCFTTDKDRKPLCFDCQKKLEEKS